MKLHYMVEGGKGDRQRMSPQIRCPGKTLDLDPLIVGVPEGSLTDIEMHTRNYLTEVLKLEVADVTLQNPTNKRGFFRVTNNRADKVTAQIKAGTVLARAVEAPQDDYVLVAAVLQDELTDDSATNSPRGVDDGGIEDLKERGFNLDKAIDPEKRRPDGSYEPLSDDKKRKLYEIALRWFDVWSVDAKVPKVSYLVVLDIPTGDAPPIAQQPYPIPEKLKAAASPLLPD